jgi:hypothetical protein
VGITKEVALKNSRQTFKNERITVYAVLAIQNNIIFRIEIKLNFLRKNFIITKIRLKTQL